MLAASEKVISSEFAISNVEEDVRAWIRKRKEEITRETEEVKLQKREIPPERMEVAEDLEHEIEAEAVHVPPEKVPAESGMTVEAESGMTVEAEIGKAQIEETQAEGAKARSEREEQQEKVYRTKIGPSMEPEDTLEMPKPMGAKIIIPMPKGEKKEKKPLLSGGLVAKILIAVGGAISAIAVFLIYTTFLAK
jgi:hypothetical protein